MFQLTAQTLWEKTISLTGHNTFQLTAHHAYRSHVPANFSDTEGEDHHTYRSHVPADCSDTEGEDYITHIGRML